MPRKAISAIMLSLLVISTLTLAFKIQSAMADSGTIYIRADGSIDPPTAPIYTADNITYTLTGNITARAVADGIDVERDNIVLDGAGYVLQGPGAATGISLSGRTNVTIQFVEIKAFSGEILLWNSSNNNILRNSITDSNGYGILLYGSSNNSISGNNVEMLTQAIPEPQNGGSGITILSSNYTMVTGNTIENTFEGIGLQDSSLNNVSANTLKNNYYGIGVVDSNYDSISENTLASGKTGIDLERCSNIIVSANNITENNADAITLYPGAVSNVLYMNNIVSNLLGFLLWNASSNSIYGNELVHNSLQVDIITSDNNSWDNGYPIGGNYWSDYNGVDEYSGPYQNVTGSDGISDAPYVIDANNIDHYPLMQPLVPYYEGETIYINADGSISPSTAPIITADNITYTLTGNFTAFADGIVVERDNITVDGAGYAVTGSGSGNGMTLNGCSNVTLDNLTIEGFTEGIYLYSSSGDTLSGNNVANNYGGIELDSSSENNSISGNTLTNNNEVGIWLNASSNNSITGNNITNNSWWSILLDFSSNHTNISGNNITNNGRGIWLPHSSDYNSISGNNITNNGGFGVSLGLSTGNIVSGNNITDNWADGISLSVSSGNSISGNIIARNHGSGISLDISSDNSISGNNITNNNYGIFLGYSDDSSISSNTFTNDGLSVYDSYQNSIENNTVNGKPLLYLENVSNYSADDAGQVVLVNCKNITVEGLNLSKTDYGIELWETNSSTISGNNIANNNEYGILLESSLNNIISGNNITSNNWDGIYLYSCSGNSILHNNFVNNTVQVYSTSDSANVWDNGYPSGGNYWSDYNGTDSNHDGIGDTPYVIDANNRDNYPLLSPWHLVGDLNGDGKVSLQDLQLLAQAYNSHPGDPNWNPLADIAQPYGIISLTDLVTMAMHYGQHNP